MYQHHCLSGNPSACRTPLVVSAPSASQSNCCSCGDGFPTVTPLCLTRPYVFKTVTVCELFLAPEGASEKYERCVCVAASARRQPLSWVFYAPTLCFLCNCFGERGCSGSIIVSGTVKHLEVLWVYLVTSLLMGTRWQS